MIGYITGVEDALVEDMPRKAWSWLGEPSELCESCWQKHVPQAKCKRRQQLGIS